ncbi:MAG: hypothetical protein ACI4EI_08530 [Muricoprocola sp.]
MRDFVKKRWRRDCFIVSCFCMFFARVTVHAETEAGNKGKWEPVFYFIPGQRVKSGTPIGEVKRPEYAWNKEKEPVYGKITWYEAQSRSELEADMELSGDSGDVWKLIWIFEPDSRFGTYENAEGIISITITEEDIPDDTVDAGILEKAWKAFIKDEARETETEEVGEELENEEESENSIVVELPSNGGRELEDQNDEIQESVSGTTNGSVKVTSDKDIPGNLLNGVGRSITGVGAVGENELVIEEWYIEPDTSYEMENTGSVSFEDTQSSSFEDTDKEYPSMASENSYREVSMPTVKERYDVETKMAETEKENGAPETGDCASPMFWMSLCFLSAIIIFMKNRERDLEL